MQIQRRRTEQPQMSKQQELNQILMEHRLRLRPIERSTGLQSTAFQSIPQQSALQFGGITRYEPPDEEAEVQKGVGIASGVIGGVAGAVQTINSLRDNLTRIRGAVNYLRSRFGNISDGGFDQMDQNLSTLSDQVNGLQDLEMQSVRSDVFDQSNLDDLPDVPTSQIDLSGDISELPEPIGSIRPISSAVPTFAYQPPSDYDTFQGIMNQRGITDQFDMPARYQDALRQYQRMNAGQDRETLRNIRQGLGLEQTPSNRPIRVGRLEAVRNNLNQNLSRFRNYMNQRVNEFRSSLIPEHRDLFDNYGEEMEPIADSDLPDISYDEQMNMTNQSEALDSGELPTDPAEDLPAVPDQFPDELPEGVSYLDDANIGGIGDELSGLGGDLQLANMAENVGSDMFSSLENVANDVIPGFGSTFGRILPALSVLL